MKFKDVSSDLDSTLWFGSPTLGTRVYLETQQRVGNLLGGLY